MTEVLLLNDIEKLGKAGDTVRVADGFARNFLFPKGLAGAVTAATQRRLEKLRKEREEQDRAATAEAKSLADKIKNASITVRAKTTDGQKLYGSVGANEIVESLASQGIAVDAAKIALEEPIKEVGSFDVPFKLYKGVEFTAKVWVVEA